MTVPRLSPHQFALHLEKSSLAPSSAQIVRDVVVDGLTQAAAARKNGCSKQFVSKLLRKFETASTIPTSWVRVETWLPPEDAARVLALSARLREG